MCHCILQYIYIYITFLNATYCKKLYAVSVMRKRIILILNLIVYFITELLKLYVPNLTYLSVFFLYLKLL